MAKKYTAIFVFALICNFAFAAGDMPQPVGWVNDFAGVIGPQDYEKLNSLISRIEEETSSEIAVVTIDSIAPYDEKEYARLLFDNWKPGKKGKDNGVLILLAVKDRLWRIEAGYGVEGVLPDALCWKIGRDYMVPYFKQGQYAEGLYQGVSAIFKALSGEALPSAKRRAINSNDAAALLFFVIIGLLMGNVIFLVLSGIILFGMFPFPASFVIFIFLAGLSVLRFVFFGYSGPSSRYRSGYYGAGGFGGGGFGGFGGGFGGGGGAGGRF